MAQFTIGRSSENNIIINNQMVSSYHADLFSQVSENQVMYILSDHSTNGTMVNGTIVNNAYVTVNRGDSIIFPGNIVFDWDVIPYEVDPNKTQTGTFLTNAMPSAPEKAPEKAPERESHAETPAVDSVEDVRNLTFSASLRRFFRHYVDFSGRARRREYWYVVLWNVIMTFLIFLIGVFVGVIVGLTADDSLVGLSTGSIISGILYVIYLLTVFIPSLALTVRRIHDWGKSGWLILIRFVPIANIIVEILWMFSDSEARTNQWGPCPKNI